MREHTYKMRVYYDDTDCGGVVYHSNYLKFMERARSEWLISVGFIPHITFNGKHSFAVHKAELVYLSPARLYDEVEVFSKITNFTRISVTLEQTVRLAKDAKPTFCTGKITLVAVNSHFKPCRIHDTFWEKLNDES
jgi:tol-pal system-associated acyl-CoA thioesterase